MATGIDAYVVPLSWTKKLDFLGNVAYMKNRIWQNIIAGASTGINWRLWSQWGVGKDQALKLINNMYGSQRTKAVRCLRMMITLGSGTGVSTTEVLVLETTRVIFMFIMLCYVQSFFPVAVVFFHHLAQIAQINQDSIRVYIGAYMAILHP
jgi:hypothetical protein